MENVTYDPAVVMLEDGRVLDPWDDRRDTLAHPDYRAVDYVAGYYRVRGQIG